jgi:site-specific DNA recombinase
MAPKQKLRFAPIIRVSTDKQQERGVSLQTQKDDIIEAVEYLGGTIPDYCWIYVGVESATPKNDRELFEVERKLFEQVLSDSKEDLFEAVIFAHIDRWSRDSESNIKARKTLHKNRIRIFRLKYEFNLNDPADIKMLDSGVVDAQYHANRMTLDSINGKIKIAKRGFPINGEKRVPFGRELLNYDDRSNLGAKAQFEIIEKDQKRMMNCATRYIDGDSLEDIAKDVGMGLSTLRTILTEHSGTTWKRHFKKEQFGIDEKFETKIPELLTKDIRDKIKERIHKNTTIDKNGIIHNYLLKGLIRCPYCGNVFYGKTDVYGHHYYYHSKSKCCNNDRVKFVKGVRLELPVLAHIRSVYSDSKKAQKAVKFAIPNPEKRKQLENEIKNIKREIAKLKKEEANIVKAIKAGAKLDSLIDEANKIPEQIREKELSIKQIKNRLSQMPDPKDKMTKLAFDTLQQIIRSSKRNPSRILEMSFDDKRKMLKQVFDGYDESGKKHGIYLKRGKQRYDYIFELNWVFKFNELDNVLMPEEHIMEMLSLDKNEYVELFKQLQTKNRVYGEEKTGVQGQVIQNRGI